MTETFPTNRRSFLINSAGVAAFPSIAAYEVRAEELPGRPGADAILAPVTASEFPAALTALRAAGGGRLAVRPATYPLTTPLRFVGEYSNGLLLDAQCSVFRPATNSIDAMFIGNEAGSIASIYFNKFRFSNIILNGKGKAGTANGIHIQAAAGNQFSNINILNFNIGLFLDGGLSSSFTDMSIRNNATGIKARQSDGRLRGINSFGPNANSFYNLRLMYNDIAVDYDYSPSTAVNWIGCNVESNNESGNVVDGVAVFKLTRAGHQNLIGLHFERNLGQYSVYYSGADSSKSLLVAGCEIIDSVGTNLHMARGRLTSIASRITNTSSKHDIFFTAGTAGTLIDTEGAISGALSNVVCLRDGKIGFGIQPVKGLSSPVIDMQSANIIDAGGVAANFRNDTVQIRFQNSAGKRVGYIQTTSASGHILSNENPAGGWSFRAASANRFYVGRGGANSIEPAANTVSCGSAAMRWSEVFAVNGAINTSDGRQKQQIRDLSAAERAVALRLKNLMRAFKFNDAVKKKGADARWHIGIIAQDVHAAFKAEGLDPFAYSILCHDEWQDQFDDDGELIVASGDMFGIRYQEMLAFIIAAL